MFEKLLSEMLIKCIERRDEVEAIDTFGKLKSLYIQISPFMLEKARKSFKLMLIENFPFEADQIQQYIEQGGEEPVLDPEMILSINSAKKPFKRGGIGIDDLIVFILGEGFIVNQMLGHKVFGRRLSKTQQEIFGLYLFCKAMNANMGEINV